MTWKCIFVGVRKNWPVAGVLVLVALCYFNSFPGQFHFDDYPLILDNPKVVSANFDWRDFLFHYGGRPFTLLTFHLTYQWFGASPMAFHLFNLLLHLGSVWGIFFLLRRMEASLEVSVFAALIFGLHPIQSQAVNYIWSRSVLLMAVFSLAALILTRRNRWLALISFQFAVWSRAEALALVPILAWLAPRNWKLFAVVGATNLALLLGAIFVDAPSEIAWTHPDVAGFWASQPMALLGYLWLMVFPRGLSIDHQLAEPGLAGTIGALLVLLLLAGLLGHLAGGSRLVAFGGLLMGLPLLPGSLVPNSDLFNESRAYLATAGFAVLVSWGFSRWCPPVWRRVSLTGLLALGALWTLERNYLWQDDVRVWRSAAVRYPEKARIRYNLGSALARAGDVEGAEAEFQASRHLNPSDDLSYAALGYCAEVRGFRDSAESLYRRALELNPDNLYARVSLERIRAGSEVVSGPSPGFRE